MIDVQAGDISGREMLITYQSGEHFNGSSWGNRIKDQTNILMCKRAYIFEDL